MGKKSQTKKSNPPNLTTNKPVNNVLKKLILKLLEVTAQTPVIKETEELQGLLTLISEIERIEKPKNVVQVDRTNPVLLENFTKWLRDNGAVFEGSSIAAFDGYDLGLKANLDIPQGSLLIAIPRKLMLTPDCESSLTPLQKQDSILKGMPNVNLAMALLVEKFTENSFWKDYIQVLPKEYNTVLYYKYEELTELIGSPTLKSALKLIKCISRQYAYFIQVIHSCDEPVCHLLRGKLTFDQYRWAVSTVMTRQNSIPSEDKTTLVNALIPLWDFCNHTSGNISTEYNPMLDRSECLAVRNFKAGEQLFIFYGARTNADLFIHNGFVYDDNEHDGYPLTLGISKSDKLKEKRTKLLEKLQINANSTFYLDCSQQPVMGKLLAFLRIFNMNEEQLQHWLESDKYVDLECLDCALDTCLEKKTWSFLQVRIKLLLAAYKTTLADDIKILSDATGLSERAKLAIRMRVSEKKILSHVLEYVEQYIKQ